MPLYQYICKCGYKLEKYRTMGKRNCDIKCPKCGELMTRLIGGSNPINLKGNDWFKKGWQ